jgi:hypothetical protein
MPPIVEQNIAQNCTGQFLSDTIVIKKTPLILCEIKEQTYIRIYETFNKVMFYRIQHGFQKVRFVFQIFKTNILNHYPELEI